MQQKAIEVVLLTLSPTLALLEVEFLQCKCCAQPAGRHRPNQHSTGGDRAVGEAALCRSQNLTADGIDR